MSCLKKTAFLTSTILTFLLTSFATNVSTECHKISQLNRKIAAFAWNASRGKTAKLYFTITEVNGAQHQYVTTCRWRCCCCYCDNGIVRWNRILPADYVGDVCHDVKVCERVRVWYKRLNTEAAIHRFLCFNTVSLRENFVLCYRTLQAPKSFVYRSFPIK